MQRNRPEPDPQRLQQYTLQLMRMREAVESLRRGDTTAPAAAGPPTPGPTGGEFEPLEHEGGEYEVPT